MSPTGTHLPETLPDRLPRVWTLWKAARPSQVALVCLVYALGLGIAAGSDGAAGASDPSDLDYVTTAGAGLLVLVPATAAIHYANEYADYETDRLTASTRFSGGSGALHRTGIDRRFLARATGAALVAGALAALAVRLTVGLPVDAAAILVAGTVLGLGYSLPPVAFVRRGGGEIVNALLGGFLLPQYGVAVVGTPTLETSLAVVPFTLVVGCNLLATHWPDREADAAVGKLTVAVRWSPVRLRVTYAVLAVCAAVLVVLLLEWSLPLLVALAHLPALPFLVWGGVVLTRQRSPFPAVAAMVVLAASTTVAWWWFAF